jgi:hypothetical protein
MCIIPTFWHAVLIPWETVETILSCVLKVLFKRSWLNLVSDVDFMTLNILKLDFFQIP